MKSLTPEDLTSARFGTEEVRDANSTPAFSLGPSSGQIELAAGLPRVAPAGADFPVTLDTRGVTPQPEFWSESKIHLETIITKLKEVGRADLWEPLRECGAKHYVVECAGCGKISHYSNHCDSRFCPMCQPRLAHARVESLEWWVRQIAQPKHVVLTCRNVDQIGPEYVGWFKDAFTRLRRSSFAANWRGGIYSMEVTNEGRGWHLHMHVLVDADWIDAKVLALKWGRLVGQDFAIVRVQDARRSDYLAEVAKYCVKGIDLASWSPQDIASFLDSFADRRTFGVFGSCYGRRTEFTEWLAEVHNHKTTCECGCQLFRIFSEPEWEWEQIKRGNRVPDKPVPDRQASLGLPVTFATGRMSMPT